MSGLTPIDFSLLGQQRSDISKVAGDDFLKIQQQQLANAVEKQEKRMQEQAAKVEEKIEIKIQKDGSREKSSEKNSENDDKQEKNKDNIQYVEYDDPELGRQLDWRG